VRFVLVACFGLAGLSLLLPSEPSYDPWAWIVWGRELALLELDTSGGPSWKPLPVAFTALFAPFGKLSDGIPPALWLVLARAGALLALVMAYRLARRLAGPARATGIGAGLAAAAALALTPQWLRNMAHGNEVPLAIAFMLWGIERHLDGARGHAVGLGFLACLLRPEVFPFLALYGLWLWRAEPGSRRLLAGLALALPALWLVPEWIGSGHPFAAGEQARTEPRWSLSLLEHPWLAALERAHGMAGLPLELGALASVAVAWRRLRAAPGGASATGEAAVGHGSARVVLALAAVALSWVLLVAAMTQGGFSGSPRYFLPAVVIAGVLAGVGAAWLVAAAARALGRGSGAGRVLAGAGMTVALGLAAAPWAADRAERLERQARDVGHLARLQADLAATVRSAGGPDAIVTRGMPAVNAAFHTRLAWEAKLALADIEDSRRRGLVFYTRAPLSGRKVVPSWPGRLRAVQGAGAWHVLVPVAGKMAARPCEEERPLDLRLAGADRVTDQVHRHMHRCDRDKGDKRVARRHSPVRE